MSKLDIVEDIEMEDSIDTQLLEDLLQEEYSAPQTH